MSRFCPFCDDVKDSELDSASDFKRHLSENHGEKVVNGGRPNDVDSEPGVVEVEEK